MRLVRHAKTKGRGCTVILAYSVMDELLGNHEKQVLKTGPNYIATLKYNYV